MSRFFEDYLVGESIMSPARTITEADISIILGITRYMEPLMIDEEFARQSHFGTRIAPGRLAVLFMGGMAGNTGIFGLDNLIGLVGLDNIQFKSPLKAGDTIRTEVKITGKKETSKPDRGVVFHSETCLNQHDQVVATLDSAHLIKTRAGMGAISV